MKWRNEEEEEGEGERNRKLNWGPGEETRCLQEETVDSDPVLTGVR